MPACFDDTLEFLAAYPNDAGAWYGVAWDLACQSSGDFISDGAKERALKR